jgi:transposase
MECPKCGKEEHVKNGKMKGAQRYKCRGCGCNYTRCDSHGKPMKQKLLAVTLHLCGMSMNSIGEVMGVTAQSVMRWVRWAADVFAPVPVVCEGVKTLEMDEMHHFLLKKVKSYGSGKCWIMTPENFYPGSVVIVISPRGKER